MLVRASKRYRYVQIPAVLVVTAALIPMMVGCGDYPVQYDLTVSSTRGGEVTSPGEGSFAYAEGTVVNLAAEAEDGYRFVRWTGNVDTVANIKSVTTPITMNGSYSIAAGFQLRYASVVAAGSYHTVGLRGDGTVVAVGRNDYEQCDVGGWSDIVQVAAGDWHTVGLKDDGTVIAVGDNYLWQCDVGGWTDIVQVAAGGMHTVGLKGDGTVVAVGDNYLGQCDVGDWSDIIQVAAGGMHTVGLKHDSTVVATGDHSHDQCDVDDWTDIVQVATGFTHTVGLKDNGTVIAVGDNSYLQCSVGDWTDIGWVPVG